MFCQNCGAKLKNDARFCYNCGNSQAAAPTEQTVTVPTDPAMPFPEKVRVTAKKVGASPKFLIAIICFTLTLALCAVSVVALSRSAVIDLDIHTILEDPSIDPTIDLSTPVLIAGICAMLPAVFIAIGLWITYGSCVSRKPKVNTAGLSIIFVVSLILLVVSCLSLLIALLPSIITCVQAENTIVLAMVLGTALFVLAIFIFVLIYYIKVCTTITNVRSTLQTGIPNKRVSRFIGLMCYISGSIIATSSIGTLFSTGIFALGEISSGTFSFTETVPLLFYSLVGPLTAVYQILFGSLIFSYRNKMEALEAEARLNTYKALSYAAPYTSPVFIPPQPAPESIPEPAVEELQVIAEPAVEEPQVIAEPAVEEPQVIAEPEIAETPAIMEEPTEEATE